MDLVPGTRLGGYEIVSALGAGGMGEVYRARDIKLNREVAIKVLPDTVAHDPERLARFEREAKTLATLNHPHIAAIYGFEQLAGVHALVMELVEGEDLSQKIEGLRAKGSGLPIDEALPIAKQIAEALEAAHEQGIIHRDLKPANIKVRTDGTVKVLDFGLAKAIEAGGAGQAGGAGHLSMSPTIMSPALLSGVGVILGTAAYMAPEQAKGRAVDRRADIWAFGAVLYEMLTGRRAFDGEDVSSTLARVIERDPDWAALPAATPVPIRKLLRRCLEKDPKRRLHDIGDARIEIEDAIAGSTEPTHSPPLRAPSRTTIARRDVVAWLAGAVVGGVAIGIASSYFKAPTTSPVMRFPFMLAEGQNFTNAGRRVVAISPSGTHMTYVANSRLYLRSMSELDARPIPGTEVTNGGGGVMSPVFSPDGQWIAFWSGADQTLKKISITGGAAITICPAEVVWGMSWAKDAILFGQSKGVMRVSSNGGRPELIAGIKSGEQVYGPEMLPGGDTVLFTLSAGAASALYWDKAQIVAQILKTGERKTLIEGGSSAQYVPTGHIVYALSGSLFAAPFDVRRLAVTGGPAPVVEGVRRASGIGTAQFSISDTGSLIYVPGPVVPARASDVILASFDRKGDAEPLKAVTSGSDAYPRVSPDGKRIAYDTADDKQTNVWIYDRSGTSSARRLTFGGKNQHPLWSADSRRVAFQSDREGDAGIFWQVADGSGTAERLTKAEQGTSHLPESWFPKGDRFTFDVAKGSSHSLWLFSLSDRKATPLAGIQSSKPFNSVFSPDGKWLAYSSNEAGAPSIYVQPFPPTGAKYQISKTDTQNNFPLWSPDGKELFYVPETSPGELRPFFAVSISTQPSLTFGTPAGVTRRFSSAAGQSNWRDFDITPDGRFIGVPTAPIETNPGPAATPQIQIVIHWFEELKQRVPIR